MGGDVGSARYEPALLPPCPTIRVLCYSNGQRSTHSHQQFKGTGIVLVYQKKSWAPGGTEVAFSRQKVCATRVNFSCFYWSIWYELLSSCHTLCVQSRLDSSSSCEIENRFRCMSDAGSCYCSMLQGCILCKGDKNEIHNGYRYRTASPFPGDSCPRKTIKSGHIVSEVC